MSETELREWITTVQIHYGLGPEATPEDVFMVAREDRGLDAAIAAIKAVRARWLEKPRTPVLEGVDIGIELALALVLIEHDSARRDAEYARLAPARDAVPA